MRKKFPAGRRLKTTGIDTHCHDEVASSLHGGKKEGQNAKCKTTVLRK
jgi:hypothetical protein